MMFVTRLSVTVPRWRTARTTLLALGACLLSAFALDQPTGAPLELSSIETEQGVPLAVLSPDGKTASCVTVRLHWNPQANLSADQDAASFALDISPEAPGASIFTAQLWNASLASALAWQQPWEGARWKILDTPATDGTGIDAALAVGLIATSARRPYPKDTLVLGTLKPDGTLGAVTRIQERLDAAASSGISRVIIPNVQRFDTDADGHVLNIVRHAEDLHLQCVPVDNLVQATEQVMHDPLPAVSLDGSPPRYNTDVSSYIDTFAQHEQAELTSGLAFAPKEAELGKYPARTAEVWKTIYAYQDAGQQAYRAGQVYMAYRIFAQANGLMHGINALSGQSRITFVVQQELADSDDLHRRLRDLMEPPAIDRGDLESALLVAEMADWAYDISAALEGAQLVTKQTFSTRTDATAAEKDRAREAIVFADAQARYLLDGADFYSGLLTHVAPHGISVDANAAHLLPQLIPAQLATAEIFTNGIRPRANELRDGLLFDPRLVAYINVLRSTKTAWETRRHAKETEPVAPPKTDAPAVTKLNTAGSENVGFDPGTNFVPPNHALVASSTARKLSDVAACLIWVNNDCEIASLDEKYLHLGGAIDPATHAWRVKDRSKLDALLQSAEGEARLGISIAKKAEIDTSVLCMIYERAAQLRLQPGDATGLDALRNYWRCAALGNMCWQLAHSRKAQPVDLSDGKTGDKPKGKNGKGKVADKEVPEPAKADAPPQTPPKDKPVEPVPPQIVKVETPPAPPVPPVPPAPPAPVATNTDTLVIAPVPTSDSPSTPPIQDNPAPAPDPIPVAPPENHSADPANPPKALPVIPVAGTNAAPVVPPAVVVPPTAPPVAAAGVDESAIPVAPVARSEDYSGGVPPTPPATNAAPAATPPPPSPSDKAATGGD